MGTQKSAKDKRNLLVNTVYVASRMGKPVSKEMLIAQFVNEGSTPRYIKELIEAYVTLNTFKEEKIDGRDCLIHKGAYGAWLQEEADAKEALNDSNAQ